MPSPGRSRSSRAASRCCGAAGSAPVPRRRPSGRRSPRSPRRSSRPRASQRSRQGLGAALLVAAGLVFLQATGSLSAARDVSSPRSSSRAVLALIFAPWIAAHGPLAHRRARRAHPLAGARGAGRAPARLGAADARARAEARRRPARGRGARARARSASCARGWPAGRPPRASAGWPRRWRRRPRTSRSATASPSTCRGRRRRSRRRAARRSWPPRARPWSTRPSSASGSPVAVYAEATDDALQVFVRDRGPGFDPSTVPRRPPRPAGVRSSGAWRATAGAPRCTAAPGGGHRGRADAGPHAMSDTRVVDRRRPRRCSAPASARSWRGASTSSATPRPSTRRWR